MANVIKDVVLDTNVMRLYDKPKDPAFQVFFRWLRSAGTLTASQKLIAEYCGSTNTLIFVLINELLRDKRYNLIPSQVIKEFSQDKNFHYTCNNKDHYHARLVFLSYRKRLIGLDKKLVNDVNAFPKVDGVKPCACRHPKYCCYS